MKKNNLTDEYLCFLMEKHGLFTDYDLYEIGITFDEYSDPDENVLEKIENYLNKKNRD